MPVFMDLHIGQDITPEIIAVAHQRDLDIQHEFNCKCLTYWFDESRGNAYCLIEAPNKEAVYELHKNSHEQLPDEIIEVDRRVIKAFLGRIHDPEVVDYIIDQKIKVFNDPAFRIILIGKWKDQKVLQKELGKEKSLDLISEANQLIRKIIEKNQGVASEDKGDEVIATFTSAIQALMCSLEFKPVLGPKFQKLDLKTAIHAGEPVERGEELFGSTLRFGKFLFTLKKSNSIYISHTVKGLLESSNHQSLLEGESFKILNKLEEEFIVNLLKVLEISWNDSSFEMEDCYSELSMSKSQLYRKCMETVGSSPNRILREYRLNKSIDLLRDNKLNVAQTAFECGFNSPSYFTKCFQKKFGLTPHLFSELKN